MPLGSPGCVDGPFLEGGDTLLNGYEIYVGISGCASDLAGADWLQALLGETYRVIPVAMKSNVLHLDCAMALIKPGLLVYCPLKLIDGLPMSLRDWDKIEVSVDEANRLATNGLVLEEGRVVRAVHGGDQLSEIRAIVGGLVGLEIELRFGARDEVDLSLFVQVAVVAREPAGEEGLVLGFDVRVHAVELAVDVHERAVAAGRSLGGHFERRPCSQGAGHTGRERLQ